MKLSAEARYTRNWPVVLRDYTSLDPTNAARTETRETITLSRRYTAPIHRIHFHISATACLTVGYTSMPDISTLNERTFMVRSENFLAKFLVPRVLKIGESA
jgi:hypothetical protein